MKRLTHFFDSKRQRQPSEQTPLIQDSLNTRNTRRLHKLFWIKLINLTINTIDTGGAFDGNWLQYMRSLRHCMPTDKQCSNLIEIEANYTALAAATFNVLFHIVAKSLKEKYELPNQLLVYVWHPVLDILEMHYFYLSFAMFMHTIAIKDLDEKTYAESAHTTWAFFLGVEVIPSTLFAILSNARVRNKIKQLIADNTPRGNITKFFDAFFELLRGFAIARSIILDAQIAIYSRHHASTSSAINSLVSPVGLSIRYIPSSIYGLFQSYHGWQQTPKTGVRRLLGTTHSWPNMIESALITLYFLIFTSINLAETPAPHRTILITSFSALFLFIFGYVFHTTRNAASENMTLIDNNSLPNNSDMPPDFHNNERDCNTAEETFPTQLTIDSEETYNRDKNSIQAITLASSPYSFSLSSTPDNVKENNKVQAPVVSTVTAKLIA